MTHATITFELDLDWLYVKERTLKVSINYVPPCGDGYNEPRSGGHYEIFKVTDFYTNRDITDIIQRCSCIFRHPKANITIWDYISDEIKKYYED